MPSPIQNIPRKVRYCVISGAVLISAGVISWFSKTWLLGIILPTIIIAPDTVIGEFWRKPPTMLPVEFYFFNWTNPQEIHNLSSKPKFEEVGPYKFFQEMEKVEIVWNDNDTVTYRQKRTWFFDDKNSKRNISDKITTLNYITWIAAFRLQNWNYLARYGYSTGLDLMCPDNYVTRSVEEIFYKGACGDFTWEFVKHFEFLISDLPRFDNLGMLSFRNGSLATSVFDEVYNVGIGVNGDFNIHNFNYRNKTHFEGTFGKVGGSTGEIYSNVSKKNIKLFIADICKPIVFSYDKEDVVDGVLGYKYTFKNDISEDKYYPDERLPSGTFNISECFYGIPAYASFPHFYSTDPVFLNDVEGLRPNEEMHKSQIIVEPTTGIPLETRIRIQLNWLIHPVDGIPKFENIPKTYFPLLWFEINFRLPEELMRLLKYFLIAPFMFEITIYILIVIGFFLLTLGLLFYIISKEHLKKHLVLLKPEEVPLRNNEKK